MTTKSLTQVRGTFPDGQATSIFTRNWQTQKKPYKAPLPYSYSSYNGAGTVFVYNNGDIAYPNVQIIGEQGSLSHAQNQSYDHLASQLGDTSQWANNLLEANESVAMIANRARQLTNVVNKIRKGDLSGAAKALGNPQKGKSRGPRGAAKSVADQFLEFHFGWEPLAQDIHNAAQTLSKPHFGIRKIRGSGHDQARKEERDSSKPNGFDYLKTRYQNTSYSMRSVGLIRVSNPNAYMANQFGLVNPLSIAWEAVPFSFVADWFGNVGQCLSAMTDFVGLEVISGYTTLSAETTLQERTIYLHPNPNLGGSGGWAGKHFYVERAPGFTGPTLALKPFKGMSITRGATAISLLLQSLR